MPEYSSNMMVKKLFVVLNLDVTGAQSFTV